MPIRNMTNAKLPARLAQAPWCFAVIVALASTVATALANEPKGDEKSKNELMGTWKLVSAKFGGQESKLEEGATEVKHVTATQYMWVLYDKDGKILRGIGGDYTLKGDTYEEIPEYGITGRGSDFDLLKGKAQTFNCKVERNKWYHSGKLSSGLTIEEVWERVEKKK